VFALALQYSSCVLTDFSFTLVTIKEQKQRTAAGVISHHRLIPHHSK
jgi:hypothetical protein